LKTSIIKIILFLFFIHFYSQYKPIFQNLKSERYADSVIKTLSVREKFAQLLMIPAYSNKDFKHIREVSEILKKEKIGGIIWMQGGPVKQLKYANYFHTFHSIPLLYAIDGEWGLSMRLDSTQRFPKAMLLGAIQNDSLLYNMGKYMARECRRIGIHLNFAPVVDINNNPLNPVIGLRSFGEDKNTVLRKAEMIIKGMQDYGVLACIKHFPGHGDTDTDSHLDLPVIPHDKKRLDSVELYPFRALVPYKPASVMVGHLYVPALDSNKNTPATISKKIVTDLLKKEMNFNGLVITDAINMKGLAKFYPPGKAEVVAFKAGNDILLFCEQPSRALDSLMAAYNRKEIHDEDLNHKCRKVLMAKFYTQGNCADTLPTFNLNKFLNRKEISDFIQILNNKAVTLLKQNSELPIKKKKIYLVSFTKNKEDKNTLYQTLQRFYDTRFMNIPYKSAVNETVEKLGKYDTSFHYVFLISELGISPKNHFGLGESGIHLLDTLIQLYKPVVCLNGSPYFLNSLNSGKIIDLIVGYENTAFMQKSLAYLLAGQIKAEGELPVTLNEFSKGSGIKNELLLIKKENNIFYKVDSLIMQALQEKAFPGCQISVMKDGKMIFSKSYGFTTYDEDAPRVHNDMVYDLASLTKILSTASALMVLESQGRFTTENKTLGDYLPELKGTGKDTLPIKMILTHRAGLQAWIPFYLRTLKKKTHEYKPGYYSRKLSAKHSVRVAKNLYTLPSMKDSIFQRITESKPEEYGKYLYSDLGYYYLMEIIERITGKKLNEFTDSIFKECGVNLCYLPYRRNSMSFIVPTEDDKIFRKQLIHGFVHDPGAALLGGVAGHAGLFGKASDVARMMHIFMNKGLTPEGKKIFDSSVVRRYTSYVYPNICRRGLCFDKPEPDANKNSPVHSLCSLSSFGHSGFTGTFAWADPDNKLVFVFLSNRVHPSAENDKINSMHIRGKIHREFYEIVKKYDLSP
jgi:beta-glucosidase-like glycosyl hydrolase/CubicO group peptidase (beta-lactamase class C family)